MERGVSSFCTISVNLRITLLLEGFPKPDWTLLEGFPNPDFRVIGQKIGLGKALHQALVSTWGIYQTIQLTIERLLPYTCSENEQLTNLMCSNWTERLIII